MKLNELVEQPIIYILIGAPGSGKSTWLRQMLSKTDKHFVIVSSDDVLERIAQEQNKTYSEIFKDHIGRATGEMKQNASDAFSKKENVIWDQTNMSNKKRRGILQQVPNGYYKVAVNFDVSDKELERRLIQRAKDTGKHIPYNIVKDMQRNYNAPTRDEGFDDIIRIRT